MGETLSTVGAGCYAGGIAFALTIIASVSVAGFPPPVPAAALALVGFVAGVAVGPRYVSPDRLGPLTGRWRPVVALFVPPLVVVVAVLVVAFPDPGGNGVFWPALAGAGLTLVGGLAIAHAAERHRTERLVAESAVRVDLPGRYSSLGTTKRRLLLVGGVLYAALVVAMITLGPIDWYLLMFQLPLVSVAWSALVDRPYVVTDAGLVRGTQVQSWDDFDEYELTDDALVIRQSRWGAKRTFPRDRIDDVDAAVNALDRYLSRVDD